jgi:hypothetical protein
LVENNSTNIVRGKLPLFVPKEQGIRVYSKDIIQCQEGGICNYLSQTVKEYL